jgi:hypothetical protein
MAPEYFDKHRGAAMGFILSGKYIALGSSAHLILTHRVQALVAAVSSCPQ